MIYESENLKAVVYEIKQNSFSLQSITTCAGFANVDSIFYKVDSMSKGCHFPDNMKFPDFSLTFPDQDQALPWFRDHLGGLGACSPQKIFKIRIFNLAENEFPHFSLTFGILSQIPWLFQVFQVSGNPDEFRTSFHQQFKSGVGNPHCYQIFFDQLLCFQEISVTESHGPNSALNSSVNPLQIA